MKKFRKLEKIKNAQNCLIIKENKKEFILKSINKKLNQIFDACAYGPFKT